MTSVNGQVIEIRRTGTPLYHFEGEIPSKEKVDAFVDALQKNNKYYFARQEVYKIIFIWKYIIIIKEKNFR